MTNLGASHDLPPPHGGKLVDRVINRSKRTKLMDEAKELPKIQINSELVWDVENIAHGIFSPLEGFLNQHDYNCILREGRLSRGLPWTIPILLDVSKREIKGIHEGDLLTLINSKGKAMALMHLEEIYQFDKDELAYGIFETNDIKHPGVSKVYRMKEALLGGKIDLINETDNPFPTYDLSPSETRKRFKERRWKTVVGFQTRNIPHLGHEHLQKVCLNFFDGLFINPIIGKKKPGDFKDKIILGAYKALVDNYYAQNKVILGIFKTEMRYAGPKEAIFHAIVRKNFGCTHFIVGRDHAGVGNYYAPNAAQEIFSKFSDLGIEPLPFPSVFYCSKCSGITNEDACPHDQICKIQFSGTKIRKALIDEKKVPLNLLRPEVAKVIMGCKEPFVES